MPRTLALEAALLLGGCASLVAQAVHPQKHLSGDADNGATIFQHACIMCHSTSPDVKIVGPSLFSEMRGAHAKSTQFAQDIIVNGKGRMPPQGKLLSDQDLADLLAYLRKL